MAIDYSLYLITDRNLVGNKDFYKSITDALKGGVTLLQVREKDVSSKEFYEISKKLKEITRKYNVPLIINDRLDIALAIDADGLHIGQDDLPITEARRILGKEKILGLSASNAEEAVYGEKMGADYLGVGPVYSTGSKKDVGETIGIEGLKKIHKSVSIPVVGIAGIGPSNIREVKKSGIHGISVISAILSHDDPYSAAKELLSEWKK